MRRRGDGQGKPTRSMTLDTFGSHIKPGCTSVHDKESTHKDFVQHLHLTSEAYSSKDLREPEDFENPLDPVNHIHYLTKRFLYARNGFDRQEIQSYLNPYAFIPNPPSDKPEKIEKLLNMAFKTPILLRYRDKYGVNSKISKL